MMQRDEAWLKGATPAQINAALEAGELDQLLGAGEFAPPPRRQPKTDAEFAASLGITVDEYHRITDPDVLAKIDRHFSASGMV